MVILFIGRQAYHPIPVYLASSAVSIIISIIISMFSRWSPYYSSAGNPSLLRIISCQPHHQHHRRRGPRIPHRPASISSCPSLPCIIIIIIIIIISIRPASISPYPCLLSIISCEHHHQHHRRRGPRTIEGYFEKFFLQVFSEIVRAIGVLTFNLGGPWLRLGEGVWCNGPFLGAMSRWDAIAGCWCHGVLHC